MSIQKIPKPDQLSDKLFVSVQGPDGVTTSYSFDSETYSLYARESQVIIPSMHGLTHISTDPVPNATTDTPGLLSADDKAKLDALTQTRLGVLGFQGAGFPDDGGFLQGDVILAAGTEFISIERIGNVIRFTLDMPQQFCGCEECAQIFWVQDESDVASIRPPSCGGKLPGVNSYGELKIYLLPESTLLNPSNPLPTLNQKGNYPTLVFKRYDDAVTPALGEFECILARNSNGTTNVGWVMTPGATGVPEAAWFMGKDEDGNQIRFDLLPNSDADLLGALLYKGHSLTRQKAAITGYSDNVLSTNVYELKFWDMLGAQPKGDMFTATNTWRYNNPENSTTQVVDPRALALDATKDLLPVGTLVDIWEFQIGESNGERLVRRFFSYDPGLSAGILWGLTGAVRFGDLLTSRLEVNPGTAGESSAYEENVNDIRLFEKGEWGITGFEDPLLLSDDGVSTDSGEALLDSGSVVSILSQNDALPEPNATIELSVQPTNPSTFFVAAEYEGKMLKFTSGTLAGHSFEILANDEHSVTIFGELTGVNSADQFVIYGEDDTLEPSGDPINNQYVANIDPTIPGLHVSTSNPQIDSERPVYLWHRANHGDFILKALVGQPDSSYFPPIDVLLRAPIDNFDDRYIKIIKRGQFTRGPYTGRHYIVVQGVDWHDLPQRGVLRSLTGLTRNEVWRFDTKIAFARPDDTAMILVSEDNLPYTFDDDFGLGTGNATAGTVEIPTKTTVAQLLHHDYNCPAVRLEFSVNDQTDSESIQLQAKAGILDMSQPYELNVSASRFDDLVRGFTPGKLAVSKIHTQQGFITSIETPAAEPDDFKVYRGGFLPIEIDGQTERWNELEIMYRQNQVWIWWNRLLITPDATLTSELLPPVVVNTPYFPVESPTTIGKVGFRLWPGAIVRQVEIRDRLVNFNEFSYGQLRLIS